MMLTEETKSILGEVLDAVEKQPLTAQKECEQHAREIRREAEQAALLIRQVKGRMDRIDKIRDGLTAHAEQEISKVITESLLRLTAAIRVFLPNDMERGEA